MTHSDPPAVTHPAPTGGKPPAFSIGSDVWPGLAKLSEEMAEVQQVISKLMAFPLRFVDVQDRRLEKHLRFERWHKNEMSPGEGDGSLRGSGSSRGERDGTVEL